MIINSFKDISYFAAMKRLFSFLDIDRYFTIFIFFISYLLIIDSRIKVETDILNVLKPDAPIAQFLAVFVIMILIKITISYIQRKHDLKIHTAKTYLIYFSVSFILYLIISNVFSLVIAALFNTIVRNFNTHTLLLNNVSRMVEFTLFGSIYLAYLFYNENNKFKTEITKYNQALSSSAIQQLKAQLNPHFLFNNLNTLDELIEEDPAKASAFLHHFSELYRYSLITSEKKLVPLQDEIQFAKNYFELMAHKYLGYYHLEIENEHQIPHVFVPPFCLQVLVENAIEHNLGLDKTPVFITISISDKIIVSNNSIPKKYQKKTGGRALKNLATQFNLLSDKNISIDSSDTHFKVTLPFINSNQDV